MPRRWYCSTLQLSLKVTVRLPGSSAGASTGRNALRHGDASRGNRTMSVLFCLAPLLSSGSLAVLAHDLAASRPALPHHLAGAFAPGVPAASGVAFS